MSFINSNKIRRFRTHLKLKKICVYGLRWQRVHTLEIDKLNMRSAIVVLATENIVFDLSDFRKLISAFAITAYSCVFLGNDILNCSIFGSYCTSLHTRTFISGK